MDTHLQTLERTMSKFERTEVNLTNKIQEFSKAQERISEFLERLLVEVEELKGVRESLKEEVSTTLRTQSKVIASQILPPLVSGFEEKTQGQGQKLKSDLDQIIRTIQMIFKDQSKSMRLRRLGYILSFCLTVVLTSLSIFYLYPQQINYGFNRSTSKKLVLGAVLEENLDKLSPEQRQYLLNKAMEKLKD